MVKFAGKAIAAAVFAMSVASSAKAATCANRDAVVDRLNANFGESLIANAMSASNNVMEIYAKPNSSTWTILLTLPQRRLTCLVASGRGEGRLQAFLHDL
ncbi:hypothetical protein [Cognatishimia activa]|uniref:hypothetical protein n=1 Tax=Cognatishimia activa TaxID=1715691 RepID=UPI0006EF4DE1|nr:hypothetical protein [Cognatishimia activa]CUJ18082.1 hypothetical protein TA5113_02553 [Cognatishimia activa]